MAERIKDDVFEDLCRYILIPSRIISCDTEEYRNLKDFYHRFVAKISGRELNEVLYKSLTDTIHPFNIAFRPSSAEECYSNLRSRDKHGRLSVVAIKKFYACIYSYISFLYGQYFKRIKKMKESQSQLPIFSYKQEILSHVKMHNVVIIAGNTGCGKSTQVPQYLLEEGYESIACTQPRRIACISLAKRVGFETLNEYGSEIAYQVRFDKSAVEDKTKVTFITEGLLLRKLQLDNTLKQYKVVIMDEIHERHLNSDVLLGILKGIITKRDDLKLVLMSATINIALFKNYFNGLAPVIEVPGRLHPIHLQYSPLYYHDVDESKSTKLDPSPYIRILTMIEKKFGEEPGDVLIFMSGTKEIGVVVDAISSYSKNTNSWIVLPLHSSLTVEQQEKVFDYTQPGIRKCVVSTNIAETSVTIDGIRFVIDSGKMKEMYYDTTFKMNKLKEFWISQASAEQRKGRAGRTGPGMCFRLYSEEDYNQMERFSSCEIQRISLHSLVLQLASIGYPDPASFDYIEQPPVANLKQAHNELLQKNALDSAGEITRLGEFLAALPVEPAVGLMLLFSCLFDVVGPGLVVCSSFNVGNLFKKRLDGSFFDPENSYNLNCYFEKSRGDAFVFLQIFSSWLSLKQKGYNKMVKWCRRHNVVERRFFEVVQLASQFENILISCNLVNRNERREKLSSKQRMLRLGKRDKEELTLHKQKLMSTPRKRKILENTSNVSSEDEPVEKGLNLKDLEFRVLDSGISLNDCFYKDMNRNEVMLLQLLICCGLYPQYAIPDETNAFRRDSELYFHLKDKQYVQLHPTCVYSYKPSVLHACADKRSQPYIIFYDTLLETNKQYLVNCYHISAIHVLLLLADSIDTSEDCTRIVIDDWLEFSFLSSRDAVSIVSDAVKLRTIIGTIRDFYLENMYEKNEANYFLELKSKIFQERRDLVTKMYEYFTLTVDLKMKYICSVDRKLLYVGPSHQSDISCLIRTGFRKLLGQNEGEFTAFQEKTLDEDRFRGGLRVTEYLRLASLKPQEDLMDTCYLRKHFYCEICDDHLICNDEEKAEHLALCKVKIEEKIKRENDLKAPPPGSIVEKCGVCGIEISGSVLDILRHKSSHEAEE